MQYAALAAFPTLTMSQRALAEKYYEPAEKARRDQQVKEAKAGVKEAKAADWKTAIGVNKAPKWPAGQGGNGGICPLRRNPCVPALQQPVAGLPVLRCGLLHNLY